MNPQTLSSQPGRFRHLAIALGLALAVLAGCGGGSASSSNDNSKTGSNGADAPSASAPPPAANNPSAAAPSSALLAKAAALNKAELERAAQAEPVASQGATGGQSKQKAAAAASSVSKFSGGTRVPVVRFYSPTESAHFYTANATEAQMVRDSLLYMQEEGVAFYASSTAATGLSPVYRYFNTFSHTHFYTISADEKAFIDANIPSLRFDGIAYYASKTAGNGLLGLTRFYQPTAGTHFYTRSAAEAQDVRTRLASLYREEGIAFYVIDPAYVTPNVEKLPHSGVTDQQCYEAGSDVLAACNGAGATALNPEQDGHRTAVNPMSYSEVPNPAGGNFARTECVKDNVTGLIWEGKAASGLRAGTSTYTHYDDATQPQRWNGSASVNPTLAEIDAASNSVGYKNYVNSVALCGYTDWRLPTVDELQGIVDYGVAYPGPTIHTVWFPNTSSNWYWTSSPYVGLAFNAWYVYFDVGYVFNGGRGGPYGAVRLVRASQ